MYLGNGVHNETLDRNALAQEQANGYRRVKVAAGDVRHDVPVKSNGSTVCKSYFHGSMWASGIHMLGSIYIYIDA